ncbi:hypothetical protein NON20_25825 (plasmid) [Synechocystis sp. B12]|nr:hypothetical protein NON20_25825 [Synechocystis sp. B12]
MSDWRQKSHKNKRDFERLSNDIEDIPKSIGDLIQSDKNQLEILRAVRKKIGEGQYGYHESNIPFEIFQNADDAVKELETFSDVVDLKSKYFVLKYNSDYLSFIHWGDPLINFALLSIKINIIGIKGLIRT